MSSALCLKFVIIIFEGRATCADLAFFKVPAPWLL